ncbi:MAG: ImmA/IrrE family metallo-endopeptidase [Solibacillus sp.]
MASCLTHLEEYVKNLYLKIGITKPQQLGFQEISDALNIQVFYWPDTSQALFTGSKGFIFLNESLSSQVQWQDYCHELGHVLLHVGNQWQMCESFRAYQEIKANQFMQHAAMPTFMLQQLPLEYMNLQQIADLFCVEIDFAHQRITNYLEREYNFPYWNCHLQVI